MIRGKVVKVTAGIMGKNWFHIQDGTGSPAKGDYDLTCTTSEDLPGKDAVVTVTGTLARNRDFGSGYFYSVIVENATSRNEFVVPVACSLSGALAQSPRNPTACAGPAHGICCRATTEKRRICPELCRTWFAGYSAMVLPVAYSPCLPCAVGASIPG